MAEVTWSACEQCGKQTPDYLTTCWKCGKPRQKSTADKATPAPIPPPPAPPKRPTGWWDCPKCGDNNPPLGERCLRCFAVRPGYEVEKPKPAPKPVPPKDNSTGTQPPPASKFSWKTLLAWGTVLATGLSIASFFIPVLAPIAAVLKSVIAALSNLPF
jgi:hypothetical protein